MAYAVVHHFPGGTKENYEASLAAVHPGPDKLPDGQILHIAGGNVTYLRFFGGKAAAPAINRTATGKAEILKALADAFDYGTALIKEQTDQSMMQVEQTNQYLGPSSRARVIYFLLGHTWDIYGQMAVYLRLNALVPPASQRP